MLPLHVSMENAKLTQVNANLHSKKPIKFNQEEFLLIIYPLMMDAIMSFLTNVSMDLVENHPMNVSYFLDATILLSHIDVKLEFVH